MMTKSFSSFSRRAASVIRSIGSAGFALGCTLATFGAPLSISVANSDNGAHPAHLVKWTDSSGLPRSAMMVDQGTGPGYLRQFTYKVNGVDRVCTGTGEVAPGDGLVQNHTGFGGDFSNYEPGPPGTTTVVLAGTHHAIIKYDIPTYQINGSSVPTTIHWLFADGRSHPIFALTQDARGTAGNLGADSRSPYGDMAYDGGVDAVVGGASYGDTYKFVTLANNPEQVTRDSAWDYSARNTIPFAMQWTDPAQADAEIGHVATVPISIQDAGSDGRNTKDYRGQSGNNMRADPIAVWDEGWTYQILNDVLPPNGPTDSKRLTWGSNFGFVGGFNNYGNNALNVRQYSQHSTSTPGVPFTDQATGQRVDAMLAAYSVFIVLGKHSESTIANLVKDMENSAIATLSAATGTVRTSGPMGVGNAESVSQTYIPAGYNRTYATWELDAAGNAIDATLTPAAGKPLDHPIFVVNNYMAAQLPASISVGAGLATPEVDYFATLDTASQKIWITVNRSSATAINLKFGAGGGGGQPQPPIIISFNPASGAAGSPVAISGANFTGATAVKFNGLSANFTVDSAAQITAIVPADATAGAISVTTPVGTASSVATFTPSAAPAQGTVSIYADQLQNGFEDWSWATVDLANATPVHAGTKSIKVTAGSFEAFRIHFSTPINTASYTGLSFWMNGGTVGGQPLVIAATVSDTAQAAVSLAAPAANTWMKYTLTLAQLGLAGLANFDGFWIQNNGGAAISAFFVDDIDLVGAAPQPQPPVVLSFNPTSGTAGSSVTITGDRFAAVSAVKFNGVNATFTINSATQITAVVPAGATAGPISVTNPDGTTTTFSNFTPTVPPPPQGTLSMYDDQLENAAEDWSWATDDLANATPVHAGTKSIKVTAGSFEAFRMHFHAPISTASYNAVSFWMNGGAAGGQPLVIAATVNDTAQAAVTLSPPPANTWQQYTITLSQLGLAGQANFDGFWIQNNSGAAISPFFIDDIDLVGAAQSTAPVINSFNPSSGQPGDLIAITGSNFGGVTDVRFNGTAAVFIQDSPSQVSATVPAGATTGPISVITANGTGTSANNFTVAAIPHPPQITSFSPASGKIGSFVVITGLNVGSVTQVKFNGTSAAFFEAISGTQVNAQVPAGATTGPLSVTNPDGNATSADNFTVEAQPVGNGTFQQMDTDDGGWFTGFAIHSSGRLYGRTDIGGLYRSDDHGDSWQFLSGDMTSPAALMVQGVAVAAGDPNIVYQCVGVSYSDIASQGIWKSTDGGASWVPLKTGIHFSGNDPERWGGECIAIRPGDDDELWTGSRGDGLWRSRDGGTTWLQLGAFNGVQFTSISLPPAGRSDIWVGASGFQGAGGVWVSVDEGATWTPISGQNAPQGVWRITREPNGKVLVAGGNENGSALFEFNAANWNAPASYTWSDITPPGINRGVPAPLVTALVDGRIIAGDIYATRTQIRSLAGVWSPIDNLTGPMPAWQRLSAPTVIEGSRNAVVQDPSNLNRWFMAAGYGPFRTTDGGNTWQYIINGVDEVTDYKVNFHPTDPNRIYLPMADHAGAVVLDGGDSGTVGRYISTPMGYPNDLALSHAILASGDRLLALGGDERTHGAGNNDDFHPRIFKSTDNGGTWTILAPAGLPDEAKRCITSAVASRDNPDDLLLALAGIDNGGSGGVYRSLDGGNSWVRTSGLPIGADYGDQFNVNADLEVDAADNNVRYLFLKNQGFYKSTNRGASWTFVNIGLPTYAVMAADRVVGGHLWVGTCCGQPIALSRSVDGGANWTTVPGFVNVMDVDAASDGVAVLGRRGADTYDKIYYSADAGSTWNEITRPGYRFGNADSVAVDPWRPGTIWISTNGRSVARYTPGVAAPQNISGTVQAKPAGRSFAVDGVTYTTTQVFNWTAGSSHALDAASPQDGAVGTRFVWNNWSDGGAQTHSVTPAANTTYTVNFDTQYQLTVVANPAVGGTVTANPAGPWYNAGQTVLLTATPAADYTLSGWNNAEAGNANTGRVIMSAPQTVTANFTASPIEAVALEGSGFAQNGQFHFSFTGRADLTYRVEASEDLVTWTLVATYPNPAQAVSFSDSEAPFHPKRFYRLVAITQ